MIRRMRTKKAFTLIELLVVIAIIALLIGILLPALREARRSARLAKGMSNIRQLCIAANSYGSEFKDRLPSFTWKAGPAPINPTEPAATGLTFAGDNYIAARNQMAYLIRARGGREGGPNMFPAISALNLFPFLTYSHLVLQDYLSMNIPDKSVINPEDRHRDLWSSDPIGYDTGLYTPNLGTGISSPNSRHPYGASYRYVAAAIDNSPLGLRVEPGPNSGVVLIWLSPNAKFGNRLLTDVQSPSQKVYLYDTFGRHFGKLDYNQWQGMKQSRQPLGCFDASVVVRVSGDTNEGCNPNQPSVMTSPNITYAASPVDPPAPAAGAIGKPYFTFTRGGLRGVDFKGGEVRTNGY
ncbi:MAG: type II secretion system protein [Phycisphaerales bacterium]